MTGSERTTGAPDTPHPWQHSMQEEPAQHLQAPCAAEGKTQDVLLSFPFPAHSIKREERNPEAMLNHTCTQTPQPSRTKPAFATSRRQLHALPAGTAQARRQLWPRSSIAFARPEGPGCPRGGGGPHRRPRSPPPARAAPPPHARGSLRREGRGPGGEDDGAPRPRARVPLTRIYRQRRRHLGEREAQWRRRRPRKARRQPELPAAAPPEEPGRGGGGRAASRRGGQGGGSRGFLAVPGFEAAQPANVN